MYLSLRCLRQRICHSLLPSGLGWVYLILLFHLAASERREPPSFFPSPGSPPYSSGLSASTFHSGLCSNVTSSEKPSGAISVL